MNAKDVSPYIESTLLLPTTTEMEISSLCEEAVQYKFRGVCVLPIYVSFCRKKILPSTVKIISVIGFPLGGNTTAAKIFEATECKKNGCDEIDMVMSLPAFKSKNFSYVRDEIAAIVNAINPLPLKVIIETSLLTHEEKIKACELSLGGGAHYVKTSTGFSSGGATVEDVKLMRSIVGDKMKVKASGGVRSLTDAVNLIQAGADTLGTSRGKDIVEGKISNQGGY